MATVIKDRDAIALGLADMYLGAVDLVNDTPTLIDTSDAYIGCLAEISFATSKKFVERYTNIGNIMLTLDNILTKTDIVVNSVMYEFSKKNLSILFGGDGTDNDFLVNVLTVPKYFRMELQFTYPNKTSKLQLIFPKVQAVQPEVNIQFSETDGIKQLVSFRVLAVSGAPWASSPYGKSIFI